MEYTWHIPTIYRDLIGVPDGTHWQESSTVAEELDMQPETRMIYYSNPLRGRLLVY